MPLLHTLRPSHPLPDATRAAAEAALCALAEARPGRVPLVLCGSLTGHAASAAPGEADLMALEQVAGELEDVPVDLILQSGGASFEVAEEILRRLRRWSSHLAVLVPRRVRGGLTLLACVADELRLGPQGVLHAPLPSFPVAGRVLPSDLGLLEGARDPSGAARARAALDHIRRKITQELLTRRGLARSEAEGVATRLTSTASLGLPGRALDARDLATLGLPLPALSQAVQASLAAIDVALQRGLPPGGHWLHGPGGEWVRPGAVPVREPSAPAPAPAAPQPPAAPQETVAGSMPDIPEVATVAVFEVRCECGTVSKVQANLETASPLQDGHWAFPPDGVFLCPDCMDRKDLRPLRRQLEEKTHRKVVT